jgi:hypothetical protein
MRRPNGMRCFCRRRMVTYLHKLQTVASFHTTIAWTRCETASKRRKEPVAIYSSHHSDSFDHRRSTQLAIQHRLGILSERRSRSALANRLARRSAPIDGNGRRTSGAFRFVIGVPFRARLSCTGVAKCSSEVTDFALRRVTLQLDAGMSRITSFRSRNRVMG